MTISPVEQIPVEELRLNPANARKPSRKQIAQLAEIIKQVGFQGAMIPRTPPDVRALTGRDRPSHVP